MGLASIRADFPVLDRLYQGKPVIFADNASTSLKPWPVIKAVEHYYTHLCSNVHRGIHALSQETTRLFDDARQEVAEFIGASPAEIIFVRNATEAIHLAAHLLDLKPENEVICPLDVHHSNLLPWSHRARAVIVETDEDERVTASSLLRAVSSQTRLLSIGHASHVSGLILDVEEMVREFKKRKISTLIDASQTAGHLPIDVTQLDCDFLVFSGHKMLGPTGVGVLYARRNFIDQASPLILGGGMVKRVTRDSFEALEGVAKFEAGTPNIEGILGLGAAVKYLKNIGMSQIEEHSKKMASMLMLEISRLRGVKMFPEFSARATPRLPMASIAVEGISDADLATLLCNRYGILARSGLHCAEPLLRHWKVSGLTRLSFYLYNTLDEIRYIAESLTNLASRFSS